ncbi:aminotransferase class V-fold PLP-dependent enzyme [Solimonas variicoloris]|uniref:aminotransferase class V-fold PLP-dependent enzyme n=1 Tax=Solimonas variicoloris TaxID=254408 RepID=UPI0003686D5F|nr:aminotransferase class V-fold PLP-dependent enzyme [Solimonas variicoloris]
MRRRELFALGAAGAATALGGRLLQAGATTPAAALPAAGDWAAVRREFAFAHSAAPRVPLNAANLTPPLQRVIAAYDAANAALAADASFHHRLLYLQTQIARLRALFARHLGVAGDDVAIMRNTTEANATIVNGFELAASDEVVLWDQNHHSNNRSWGYRRARTPFVCRVVRVPAQPRSDAELIAPFVAALGPRTRVVSFSQISNISGLRLPAAALCRAIHAYRPDIFVHVDGAQGWGSTALDLAAMDCDSYSSSAHKWLMGPREMGILYVRRARVAALRPSTVGYDYAFDYPETALADGAARFECLGQRNDASFAALATALEFHLALGAEAIEARIQTLGTQLRERLRAAGLRLQTPDDERYAHGISVVASDEPARAVAAFRALYEQHGLYAAYVHGNRVLCDVASGETGELPLALRLCTHVYNDEQDLDTAVAALKAALA